MNENICQICSTVDPTNCYSVNPECRVRQNELKEETRKSQSLPSSKLEWEKVEDELAGYMRRAKVPGGWIYRHTDNVPVQQNNEPQWGLAWQTSMVFVPDVEGK